MRHHCHRIMIGCILAMGAVMAALSTNIGPVASKMYAQLQGRAADHDSAIDPTSPEAQKKAADEAARGRLREKSLCLAGSDSASGLLVTLYDEIHQNNSEASDPTLLLGQRNGEPL